MYTFFFILLGHCVCSYVAATAVFNVCICILNAFLFLLEHPHIAELVIKKIMNRDFTLIHTTSNHPSMTYAINQLVNTIEDLCNYECFLAHPFDLNAQPHVLIFVDDKDLSLKVAQHLDSLACLPGPLQGKGIVMHYHSGMSEQYLTGTQWCFYNWRRKLLNSCRYLWAIGCKSF